MYYVAIYEIRSILNHIPPRDNRGKLVYYNYSFDMTHEVLQYCRVFSPQGVLIQFLFAIRTFLFYRKAKHFEPLEELLGI